MTLDQENFTEKYRPRTPDALVGTDQIQIATKLLEELEAGTVRRELLFTGPSGVGKTTIALMFLVAACGIEYDKWRNSVTYVNCGDDTGVDNIRLLIPKMRLKPWPNSNFRAFILDEVHKLTNEAQSALLTEVEPVPPKCILVAATTNPEKMLKTLRHRFDCYKLGSPTRAELETKLGWVLQANGKTIADYPAEVIEDMLSSSEGSVRVIDRLAGQLVADTYVKQSAGALDADDPESLISLLFFKDAQLQRILTKAEAEADHERLVRGLLGMALSLFRKGSAKSPRARCMARAVIEVFTAPVDFTMGGRMTTQARISRAYFLAQELKQKSW